jgi:iron complex outermembrane recepter protein
MQTKKRFQRSAIAVAVATSSIIAGHSVTAVAQEEALMEEIIVTATRRDMTIHDIPFNISAVSGTEIEEANIVDAQELLRAMPGITVPDSGARLAENNNNITIRGLNINPSATDRAFLSDPTVSTYIGNTPIFGNFTLKDIKRVEVMRGPQGTLYGSGSLGGTVRYILNEPSLDGFEAKVDASYGQTDGSDGNNYSLDGMVNFALGDTAALRINAGRIDNDGVIDYANVYQTDGQGIPIAAGGDTVYGEPVYKNEKDADTVEVDYIRAALKWAPTDNFDAELTYMKQEGDFGGRRQQTSGLNGWDEYYDDHEIGAVILEPAETENEFTSLELEYDFGFATLSSSTSYYERSYEGTSDNTGFFASRGWLYWYGYGNFPRPAYAAERQNTEEALVQEFRLVSNGENTIDWVAGAFYMDQEATAAQQTHVVGFQEWWAAADGVHPGYIGDFYDPSNNVSFDWTYDSDFTDLALFGELTWNITDSLQATVGARYFDNENKVTSQTSFPIWYFYNPVINTKETDSDTLFKGNLSWNINDNHMLYGTVSEGYRRGGTNAAPVRPDPDYPNDPEWNNFDSDSVINYELGTKGQFESLSYTVALFYIDWQDPQVNVATPSGAYYAVANGESAETMGVESEFNWAATDSVRLFGGYTYVDAALSDDLYLHDASADTDGKSELRATDGAQLPGTAEHTVNIGASHTWAMSSGLQLVSRIDGYYQSEVENSILNIDPDWAETMDGFSLWNLSFTLISEAWTASLYAKNLFNEEGSTATYKEEYMTSDPSMGFYGTGQKDFITTPRTISISGSYRF